MREEEEDYCPAGFCGVGQSLAGFVALPTYQSTVRLMVSFPACPARGSDGLGEGRGWCVTLTGCS